jgi:murein L,D-transpeptidase YcbB/YkuD
MNNARTIFRTALLGAGLAVCVAGAALAQKSEDPRNDPRLEGWTDIGSPGVPDQESRLEEALARYRHIEARGGWGRVPTDLVMGPEYSYDCKRIAVIERRMIAEGYLERGSTPRPPLPLPPGVKPPAKPKPPKNAPPPREPQCRYTRDLAEAIKAFQLDRKILGYGQLGGKTMTELNRPVEEIVAILERDLARWRQVPLAPSGTYILVTIPFFDLRVYEAGDEVLRMPVVVGKKEWQTPVFSDELEYIIVNPDWGIPDTIAKLEYWPSARRNPKWLANQGITASGTSLRQKPGPRNPLGKIKFLMPNEHDVYLHDTPEKGAFKASVRALSHGCIRLSRPMDLGYYLLRDHPEWSPRRLDAAVATGRTQQINLARRMPVHIVYSTSRVNADGRVEIRPDVYGKNRGLPRREEEPIPREFENDRGP